MNPLDALSVLVATMAAFVGLYELTDIRRAPLHRKFVRWSKGVLMGGFCALFLYAWLGPDDWMVYSGTYSRIGLLLIFFVMYIDTRSLRRAQERGDYGN